MSQDGLRTRKLCQSPMPDHCCNSGIIRGASPRCFPYTITRLLLKSQHVMRDTALEFGLPSGTGKLIPLLLDAGTSETKYYFCSLNSTWKHFSVEIKDRLRLFSPIVYNASKNGLSANYQESPKSDFNIFSLEIKDKLLIFSLMVYDTFEKCIECQLLRKS